MDNQRNNNFNDVHNNNVSTFNAIIDVINNTLNIYNENMRVYNNNITNALRILNLISENIDLSDASNLYNNIHRNRNINTYRNFSHQRRSEPIFNTDRNDNIRPRRTSPRPQSYPNRNPSPRARHNNVIHQPSPNDFLNSLIIPNIQTFAPPQLRLSREIIQNSIQQNNDPLTDLFNNINFTFQNVPVFPSLSQIQSATTCHYYTDLEFNNNPNERCPITMDEFQINDEVCVIRHCGHVFKKESLYRWFNNNVRCPVCRYDIRDYRENDNENNNDNETVIDISNNNNIIENIIENNNETISNVADLLSNAIGDRMRTLLEVELQIPLSRTNSDISQNNI